MKPPLPKTLQDATMIHTGLLGWTNLTFNKENGSWHPYPVAGSDSDDIIYLNTKKHSRNFDVEDNIFRKLLKNGNSEGLNIPADKVLAGCSVMMSAGTDKTTVGFTNTLYLTCRSPDG